ncbi:MAG TPA: formate dehydrogenase subunit gamma [Alphaproteobacteria bacterium]|nr:formate dehydrogenase subunit gamma [Alphaproteobacteria bacterium]
MAQPRKWNDDEAGAIVARHRHLPGAMLPILHALQDAFGYVDRKAIPLVADALNVSRAEVHGVLGFYHDYRTEPAGRHVIKLCRAEACQSMGCETLLRHVEERVGAKLGATNADRSFTIEPVYCLGNCALSPALMLDGKLHGRVTPERADWLIAEARANARRRP